MAIRNELLGGISWTDGTVLYSEDLNDTIDGSIIMGGYGNLPLGSIAAWHKNLWYDLNAPIETLHSGSSTNNTITYTVGRTYTNTGDFNKIDFVYFTQTVNSTSRETQAYVLITYTDATTYQSSTYITNSTAGIERKVLIPYTTKTISKIEIWHRINATTATATVSNLKGQYNNWINFLQDNTNNTWVECNGQTLSDAGSIFNGKVIPALNNSLGTDLKGRFLRGHSDSGLTESNQNLSHTHTGTSTTNANTSSNYIATGSSSSIYSYTTSSEGGTEARPSNYSVVWIMRIK
jgi:hypothetical protein